MTTTTGWLKQIAILAGLVFLVVDALDSGRFTTLAFGLILAGGLYPTDRDRP